MRYKTVAGPARLMIKKDGDFSAAVQSYADIIEREAVNGWEFHSIQEIPVTKDKGCLAGCLSAFGLATQYETITFNMLIFVNKN